MGIKAKAFVVKAISPDVPTYSIPGIYEELKKGKARIGWSYEDRLDLRLIRQKIDNAETLDEDEKDAKRCLGFLERVSFNDYLLYPHQPSDGKFAIVRVIGDYDYCSIEEALDNDFRSNRPCEIMSENPIDLYDEIVPSQLRKRLGRPGRFSQIYDHELIQSFLNDIPNAGSKEKNAWGGRLSRIATELKNYIPDFIRKEFSQQDLSRIFCKNLFEEMGLNTDIREGPGEKGSDIIVNVSHPLIKDELIVGIQVFAFEGTVSLNGLEKKLSQLLNGWQHNGLDYGVLLTTGNCGKDGVEFVKKHNLSCFNKPVILIDGSKLTELFLKYAYSKYTALEPI